MMGWELLNHKIYEFVKVNVYFADWYLEGEMAVCVSGTSTMDTVWKFLNMVCHFFDNRKYLIGLAAEGALLLKLVTQTHWP